MFDDSTSSCSSAESRELVADSHHLIRGGLVSGCLRSLHLNSTDNRHGKAEAKEDHSDPTTASATVADDQSCGHQGGCFPYNLLLSNSKSMPSVKVPVDFTSCGPVKVIKDPKEIRAVTLSDQRGYPGKYSGSRLEFLRCGSPPEASKLRSVAQAQLLDQPWYHYGATRERANQLLEQQNFEEGLYLVRPSETISGAYVISLAHDDETYHYPVTYTKVDERLLLTVDGGKTLFADLTQLVSFYQLNIGHLCSKLIRHIPRGGVSDSSKPTAINGCSPDDLLITFESGSV